MPHFSELSDTAQDVIVETIMGQPPAQVSDAVKAEIKAWAETDDFATEREEQDASARNEENHRKVC